mmetsp:Transcript_52239/g.145775  ORF Transcript_52239/g.145775 Transcript_52239/m.145775 type:complete len:81 (-) Transcript_52239:933-1175(-)
MQNRKSSCVQWDEEVRFCTVQNLRCKVHRSWLGSGGMLPLDPSGLKLTAYLCWDTASESLMPGEPGKWNSKFRAYAQSAE